MAKLVFDRGRESGGSRADGLCAAVAGPRFTVTAFSRHTSPGPLPPHGGALLEAIGISLAWQVVTVLDGAKCGRADRWATRRAGFDLSVRRTSLASPLAEHLSRTASTRTSSCLTRGPACHY